MSAFYRIAYQVGFHPWEDLADHPPFADTLTQLIAREEGDGSPPFGRALDVGSGSGVWGVRLAQRGWDVTGVELVAKAVARARKRVAAADVQMRIVRADVTKLRARRPQAAALVAQLADPDRGWDAIVIGEYERAFCGSQYASMAPLFEHYGIQLWMPEVAGRVDWHAEDHEQTMLGLGLSSKRAASAMPAHPMS